MTGGLRVHLLAAGSTCCLPLISNICWIHDAYQRLFNMDKKRICPQRFHRSSNDRRFKCTNAGSKGHSVFAVTLHDSSCKSVSSSAALRSTLPRGLWTSQQTFHVCSENTLLGNLSERSPLKSQLKGLEIRGHHLSVNKLVLWNQSINRKLKCNKCECNQI